MTEESMRTLAGEGRGMKTRHIATALTPIAMYLMAAFIAMDLNPANWSMDGRWIFVVLTVIATGAAATD